MTSPFFLSLPGVELEEMKPWAETDQVWRVVRVTVPSDIPTRSAVQDFYFGADYLLRRHDIADALTAAQLVYDYVEVQELRLSTSTVPTTGGTDGRPTDTLMVSMDLSDVQYNRGKDSIPFRDDSSNYAGSVQSRVLDV